MSTPVASSITSDSVQLSWLAPAKPNGVIIGYEVFRRISPFTGQGVSIASLSVNELSVSITELNAFTEYEFAVSAATVVGATLSQFVRITTLESGKLFIHFYSNIPLYMIMYRKFFWVWVFCLMGPHIVI